MRYCCLGLFTSGWATLFWWRIENRFGVKTIKLTVKLNGVIVICGIMRWCHVYPTNDEDGWRDWRLCCSGSTDTVIRWDETVDVGPPGLAAVPGHSLVSVSDSITYQLSHHHSEHVYIRERLRAKPLDISRTLREIQSRCKQLANLKTAVLSDQHPINSYAGRIVNSVVTLHNRLIISK